MQTPRSNRSVYDFILTRGLIWIKFFVYKYSPCSSKFYDKNLEFAYLSWGSPGDPTPFWEKIPVHQQECIDQFSYKWDPHAIGRYGSVQWALSSPICHRPGSIFYFGSHCARIVLKQTKSLKFLLQTKRDRLDSTSFSLILDPRKGKHLCLIVLHFVFGYLTRAEKER